MDKKAQMVTIFFSFFLILAVITIISIESANLSTNENINSLQQAYNLPKLEYYNFLNVVSKITILNPSDTTNSIFSSTMQNIYDNLFQSLDITEAGINTSSIIINSAKDVPLLITNNQNVATSSPFQQMINLSISQFSDYISTSPFGQNVEFAYSNGTVIPSWLESYSSKYAIWWVKIGSIPASSNITIYMTFFSNSTNLFNTYDIGEAPQLSPTYGEYDDGASVFNNYDNFAGNSLNSSTFSWTSSLSYTVDNGLTLEVPSSYHAINSKQVFGTGSTFDFYGEPTNNNGGGGYDFGVNDCVNCVPTGDSWMVGASNGGNGPSTGYSVYLNNTYTHTNYVQGYGVWTVGLYGQTAYSLFNYSDEYTAEDSTFTPSPGSYTILIHSSDSGNTFIQWIDERSTPPNGVMPSVQVLNLLS